MRRIDVKLSKQDRDAADKFRRTGRHLARETNRAHILVLLDRGLPIHEIAEVLGVTRVSVWRAGATYMAHGLQEALTDHMKGGQPRRRVEA